MAVARRRVEHDRADASGVAAGVEVRQIAEIQRPQQPPAARGVWEASGETTSAVLRRSKRAERRLPSRSGERRKRIRAQI